MGFEKLGMPESHPDEGTESREETARKAKEDLAFLDRLVGIQKVKDGTYTGGKGIPTREELLGRIEELEGIIKESEAA